MDTTTVMTNMETDCSISRDATWTVSFQEVLKSYQYSNAYLRLS